MTISSFVLLAALAVVEHDSSFDILRDDVVVARDIRVDRGANVGAEDVRSTATVLPDGTKVWNRWSEGADRRFRLEVGERTDGAIEVTMAAELDGPSDVKDRFLTLTVPKACRMDERTWSAAGGWIPGAVQGVAAGGVLYDFRAMGQACEHHFPGANVVTNGAGDLVVRAGKTIKLSYGEYIAVKWVIREGRFEDFETLHALPKFHYTYAMPVADTAKPLAPGYYIETTETTDPVARTLRRTTRARHLAGAYSPQTNATTRVLLQKVLADGEDFSLSRGFWLSKGYEPGVLYRSDWYEGPPKLGVAETVEPLPEEGKWNAATKAPPAPVSLPDPTHPALADLSSIRLHRLFVNDSMWAGLEDPAFCRATLDRELKGKNANTVMLSALLDRHDYPESVRRRMRQALGNIVDELHRRGLKVLDHIDITLLWNHGSAYRTLLEDPGILIRNYDDNACGFQTCILNPGWRERMFAYLRDEVAAGVDGFQLDEVYFWRKGCTCATCRAAFRRDTDLCLPPSGDPAWNDRLSPFRRAWRDWRIKTCTNFFVELRERVKDLNDHLILSAYSYTGGFVSYGSGEIGQELFDLSRVINLFGIEVMTRDNYWSSRAELPFRRAYGTIGFGKGTPVWTWNYSSSWQADYCAWAMAMMAGLPAMLSEVPSVPWGANYAGFDATRGAMKRAGATPIAKVALQFSVKTRDFASRGNRWYRTLFGTAQALEALHIPYEFVPDSCWDKEHLAKYDVALAEPFEEAFDFCQEPLFPNHHVREQTFDFNPDPKAEAAFRARVAERVAKGQWWTIDAPEKVRTSLWREADGAICVHFLNLTGCTPKAGEKLACDVYPSEAYPALEKDVTFTLPGAAGRKAVAVSPDFDGERMLATVANPDGSLTVTLPKESLKVYTLVRLADAQK